MRDKSEYLEEILTKGGVSIAGFFYKRLLMTMFSYLTTNFVGTDVYGYLSVLIRGESTVSRFTKIMSVSNIRTLPRLNERDAQKIHTTSLVILIFAYSVISVLTLVLADSIARYSLLEPRHKILVQMSVIFFASVTILSYISSIYKSRKEIRKSVIFSEFIRPSCYVLSVSVPILLVFNTAVSIWIPVTIFISISSVISLAYLFKEVSLTSDIYPKSELIREYISHVLHTALLGLTSILHRDFIFIAMSLYLSPISAGLFSLSLILADSCRWALSGINQIFPSIATKLYENGSMNELNKLYQSTSKIATVISCVPVIIVSAYHKEIMTIFSPQYANHSIVLLVAVIAQVSATVVGSVGLLLLMTDNERLSLYVNITNAVLVVPVSIYLASKFGVFGLSVAFLLTMVYNNMAELIALYHSEELMPLTRDHLYILILTALLSITSIIVKSTMGRYTGFLFCLALAAVLGVFCYRYLLDSYEKEALQNVSLLT